MNDRARRIIPLLLGSVVLYVAYVLVDTELSLYAVSTAGRTACRSIMTSKVRLNEFTEEARAKPIRQFMMRTREAEVVVKEEDATFTLSDRCDRREGCTCEFSLLYSVEHPWPLLSDFFPELKPWSRIGEKRGDIQYLAEY